MMIRVLLGNGNVPKVQLSLGVPSLELQRRPVIITPMDPSVAHDPVAAAKEAVAGGVDLVRIPAARIAPGTVPRLAHGGVGCVAVVATVAELDMPGVRDVVALEWAGAGPVPAVDVGARTLLARSDERLRPGDGRLVDADEPAPTAGLPPDVFVIVDLTAVDGRAALAAAVTVALERGAHGFLTTSPKSVRRAAYVVRAVELAR